MRPRPLSTSGRVAAGQLRHADHDLLIEVEGKFDALQHIRQTPFHTGTSGQIMRLGDVATVSKTIASPPAEIALIDGRPGIAIAVRMEPDRRVDQWAAQARDLIAQMRRELQGGIALRLIFDQSRYVGERLASLQMNLMAAPWAWSASPSTMPSWSSPPSVNTRGPAPEIATPCRRWCCARLATSSPPR